MFTSYLTHHFNIYNIQSWIGYCFAQSKILNLAINRVQNEIKNQSGEITPQFLLEQWNKGLKMDRSMFDSYTPISPHEEHVIQFRSRT